jgi:hypothetical protein
MATKETPACIQAEEALLAHSIELGEPPFNADATAKQRWANFANVADRELHCYVCKEVLIDPVSMTCCGAAACLLCLDRDRAMPRVEDDPNDLSDREIVQLEPRRVPSPQIDQSPMRRVQRHRGPTPWEPKCCPNCRQPLTNLSISRPLALLLEFYCGKEAIEGERQRRVEMVKKLIANRDLALHYLKSQRRQLLDSLRMPIAGKLIDENPRWRCCTKEQFGVALNAKLTEMAVPLAGPGEFEYLCQLFAQAPVVYQGTLLFCLVLVIDDMSGWTADLVNGIEFMAVQRVLPLQAVHRYLELKGAPEPIVQAFRHGSNRLAGSEDIDAVAAFVGELDPELYKDAEAGEEPDAEQYPLISLPTLPSQRAGYSPSYSPSPTLLSNQRYASSFGPSYGPRPQ